MPSTPAKAPAPKQGYLRLLLFDRSSTSCVPQTQDVARRSKFMHPHPQSRNASKRTREAESLHRTPLTGVELRTPNPGGEDARGEERDGESLASQGSQIEAAVENSRESTLAGATNIALDKDEDLAPGSGSAEPGGGGRWCFSTRWVR